MSGFLDSFFVAEIFISTIVIFTLYYLFFSQKKRLKKTRKTIFVFSIILFIFLQHILFEVVKYFLGVSDIVFFRFVANVVFIPMMFFLFFYIKNDVDYGLLKVVVFSYFFAVVFVGLGWFWDFSFINFMKTFFKISTSILFYILVIEYLIIKK